MNLVDLLQSLFFLSDAYTAEVNITMLEDIDLFFNMSIFYQNSQYVCVHER